ncbi:hypothetical protein EJB05_01594, partial [Eragrostis curvula]
MNIGAEAEQMADGGIPRCRLEQNHSTQINVGGSVPSVVQVRTSHSYKKRSRAIDGPDARIGTGHESAITRAIREANATGARPVFLPKIGTIFNSCEEGRDYYNLYSWERGFGIRGSRKGRTQHLKGAPIVFNVPIEKHANEIYTRAMYSKFHQELYHSGSFAVTRENGDGLFHLEETSDGAESRSGHLKVVLNSDKAFIKCECGYFEHTGMLCHHSLKVLVRQDIAQVPSCNILRRWTKDAKQGRTVDLLPQIQHIQTKEDQRSILILRALELANTIEINDDSFLTALEALETAKMAAGRKRTVHDTANERSSDMPLQCPHRPVKRGRRNSTSLRSWHNARVPRRKVSAAEKARNHADSEDDENPANGKTRYVHELVRQA